MTRKSTKTLTEQDAQLIKKEVEKLLIEYIEASGGELPSNKSRQYIINSAIRAVRNKKVEQVPY